eukprot:scaffold63507_cov35-Tisochrysis_lutea.AAC.1
MRQACWQAGRQAGNQSKTHIIAGIKKQENAFFDTHLTGGAPGNRGGSAWSYTASVQQHPGK